VCTTTGTSEVLHLYLDYICFLLDLLPACSHPLHPTYGIVLKTIAPLALAQMSRVDIANAPHFSALKAYTRSLILDTSLVF
jgi:hypothetical protein